MSFPPNLGITSSFIIVDSASPSVFQEFPSLLPQLDKICSPFSRTKMSSKYSKIQKPNSSRSKSVDFSDLSFSTNPTSRSAQSFSSNSKFKSVSNTDKIITVHTSIPENEDEEQETGEVFGIILHHKKCPVSDQKVEETSYFQTAVKRSFSLKRSASVSEGYSRIHHKSDLADAEDEFTDENRDVKKKKSKFLKAVRKLFRM